MSLLSTNPFFGVLSLRLQSRPGKVETIAGDGITLTYNEEWVSEAPHDEIKGAIAHIVYGCALKHHVRRGDRDFHRWQKASRIATAELLQNENIWTPLGLRGEDLPVELIYDKLPEEKEGQGSPQGQPGAGMGIGVQGGQGNDQSQPGQGQGSPQGQQQGGQDQQPGQGAGQQPPPAPLPPGEIQDAPEDQREEQDQAWDQASKQAIQISKTQGHDAGNIAQPFKDQHTHRRDWQDILLEYMRSAAPSDYSWSRPNRRFIDQGLYLPSLHGQGMGPIVIAIDTSSSVDDYHVNQAMTEMFAIARDVGPERIHLVQCDTQITEARNFDPADAPSDIQIKGRGGTSLHPVFKYVEDQGLDPELLIYMTDLEVSNMPDEPGYPVIWAVENEHQEEKAPFGQTIVVKEAAA